MIVLFNETAENDSNAIVQTCLQNCEMCKISVECVKLYKMC